MRYLHNKNFDLRLLSVSTLIALVLLLPSIPAAARGTPQIVVVNSYHSGFAWSDSELSGLLEGLKTIYPNIDPSIEYLDTIRNPDNAYFSKLKNFLLMKYMGKKIDLIVCLDNPALELLLHSRNELFSNTPIVFAGIGDFEPSMLAGHSRVTGIAEMIDIKGTLEIVLRLHPKTKQILVAHDHSVSGLAYARAMEALAPSFKERVTFSFLPPTTYEEASAQIGSLSADSIVLLLPFVSDRSGRNVSASESTRLLTSEAQVPVYGVTETRLGHGIIGGMLLSGKEHGRGAAKLIQRILDGEDPGKIPVVIEGTATPMFDYTQLERFGISMECLPRDSFILNRPRSVLEDHRDLALGAMGVMVSLAVMVIGMGFTIRHRRRIEAELRRSEAHYRLLSENTADVIWKIDPETSRCTYVSPSVYRLRGFTPEEAIAHTLEETLTPASCLCMMSSLPDRITAFSSGDQSARVQTHVEDQIRKDGSIVPTETVTTLITNDDGQVTEILGVSRDITERRRAERDLLERKAKIASIFRAAPIGIGMTIDRVFQEVNNAMSRITGYTREELLGHSARILYATEEDYEQAGEPRFRQMTESDTGVVETRWRCKDGTFREVVLESTYLEGADPSKGIIFTALDVTERNETERSLHESEYFLRKSQEIARLGSYCFDLKRGEWVSSATLDKVFGIGPEYLRTVGGWVEIIHPDQRKEMFEYLEQEVISQQALFDREYRIIRRDDGQERWVHGIGELEFDQAGHPVKMVGTIQDITERKRTEETLRENEQRLRLALAAANQGFYDLNVQTGRGMVSPEYAMMLGYDSERFMETVEDWVGTLHPDDRKRAFNTLTAYFEEKIPKYSDEYRQRTRSGKWKWMLAQGKIVAHDSEGKPLRMLGTCMDITEKKLAQEEKAKLESQLIQAQKMESIGRLAGGIAHDFNNMLSVAHGYAELIEARLPLDDPLLTDIREIKQAAESSRDLTRQLLAFSRKEIIAPKVLQLNEHITRTQKTLTRLIGEDILLRFQPGDDLGRVKIDPSQLDQILVNLCVNARDAMPEGGRVTIQTTNAAIDTDYLSKHYFFMPGDYILLEISDEGVGMDQETLSHIFEPFFTTKELGRGTGLGLATVYGIVKQNNGFINVYSEPGQGTTFKVYFPRVEAGATTQKVREAPIALGAGTILLVEDAQPVRKLISNILEAVGYSVLAAETPHHAISICKDPEQSIDLLLTDVVMPEMSGAELRDKVASIRSDIKVLFMSGYTEDAIAHRGVLEDGIHFIQKPFNMRDIACKIREIMQ